MRQKVLKFLPWISFLCLLLVAFLSAQAATKQVTIYCSAQAQWCEAMAKSFEKETGIHVAMTRKSTGEVLAQIKAEGANPKGDIWWGGTGDPHLQAAEEKLTYAYTPKNLKSLRAWSVKQATQSEFRTVGVYAGALGIAYNTKLLKKRKLKAPKCWKDLLSKDFKDEVQVANPNSSGTAYTLMATIVQLFGEKKGFEYLRNLHENINQYTKSGSAPLKAAARGETTIGIGFMHDAVILAKKGFPIEIVAPCEGTGYEIGSMSVVRGAPNLQSALTFYNWALKPVSQNIASTVRAYQVPSHPEAIIPKEAPKFENIKLIDYDFKKYGSSSERKRLLAKWDAEIKRSK
jgi:iron(III) transport system substrate-binding protein